MPALSEGRRFVERYLDRKPNAMPKELQKAAAEAGIKMTVPSVNSAKYEWRKKRGLAGRDRRARVNTPACLEADTINVGTLQLASKFVEQAGSATEASRALAILASLRQD